MMMRQTAHIIWIKELLNGIYEEKEGWEPNVMHTSRGRISRCNVMGVIIQTNNQYFIDDGTGSVNIRFFEGEHKIKTGDFVQIIGRPREYNKQKFIVVETIKQINPLWGKVRKQQLGPLIVKKIVLEENNENKVIDNKAEHIISIIEGLDKGDGVHIDEVIKASNLGDVAESIINQLLLDGEIFEIRPGFIKVL